ncbi:MAG TPA: thymidylate kinase, partial [Allosphingosinicella sp.]
EFARDEGRLDRFGRKAGEYHRQVAESFRELANADPGRFREVSAQGSMEEVTDRLLAALADMR